MRKQSSLSSAGMFLTELLIAILVFAVASAICVRIFVTASFIASDSSELNRAVIMAQNGAECFKAANGDLAEAAILLGAGIPDGDAPVMLFLDDQWQTVSEPEATYIVTVSRVSRQVDCVNGQVSIDNLDGEQLYSIPVSVMEVAL